MIVFGGTSTDIISGFLYYNDVWSLGLGDSGGWTELHPLGTPPSPRAGQCAIDDPLRGRMLVFGGSKQSTNYPELWQLSLRGSLEWSQLHPAGTPPVNTSGIVGIYDPLRDQMLVLSGSRVWALSMGASPAWTELATGPSPSGMGAIVTAVYDPIGDGIIAFASGVQPWGLNLGSPGAGWVAITTSGNAPQPAAGLRAVHDPQNDRTIVFCVGTNPGNQTWAIDWGRAVPTLASVASVRAEANLVHLEWFLGGESAVVNVERAEQKGDWSPMGEVSQGTSGLISFDDTNVIPGRRYGYRIASAGIYSGETWVDVPLRSSLSIAGEGSNPGRSLMIRFSLPRARPATLEVFDARGRRIASRLLEGFGPGLSTIRLAESDSWGSGLYFMRLVQDGETAVGRTALIH